MSVPDSSSKVYLNVPFPAKERAKGLGARWDPVVRKWYVSERSPLEPFQEWLPPAAPGDLFAAARSDTLTDVPENGVALSAFLAQVAEVVALQVRRSQWVRAEISQLRQVTGGHLAIELVEHDSEARLVARLQSFVWSSRAGTVCGKFAQGTGAELAVGLKVLLQLSAELNPAYGLRAIVEDIDPAYTLGDIEAKLKAIRETLAREGIAGLNRGLPAPAEFCHVAVISPQDAAGLGDFRRDADRLQAAGLCRFEYYTAKFQGQAAASSLLTALDRVRSDYERGARFDALAIIRGGGSVTDLYWLNELELARAVCRMPVPIFTGIGHERDNTVLDDIAHCRCDTPSKVIGFIAGAIAANANAAIEDMLGILRAAGNAIAIHERGIELLRTELEASGRRLLTQAEHEVGRLILELRHQATSRLQVAEHALELHRHELEQTSLRRLGEADQQLGTLLATIGHFARQRLSEADFAIESLARELLGLGPKATLQRGFALVRDERGGVVSAVAEADKAGALDIEFRDGHIRARVEPRLLKGDTNE
ncbi:exodeoxyribonuclease VII large subunit [Methylotetracoccus oryzae]|uniref:exodeoxyribonuclease VII large subunit n=1 Tax=Methylotetracoccus oryzae TaxID=1919059 RepID=UPI00111808C3|nr:exodeoxyribonuclease VII large subunit [Methylotetracoccus oryzae]